MSNINTHIKHIVDANDNNRLAVFVGTGLSMTANTKINKIPSWGELIEELKTDLNSTDNDFLRIAQLFYLEFGAVKYFEKIKSYFPDSIEPSSVHKILFKIAPEYIITTNWDTLLEKANNGMYELVRSDSELVQSSLRKKIIKIHGDFSKNNIVFKEDDYLNYQYNFPLIENYIKSILTTHTVLFIGYSYNDVNLKHIINWLKKHSDMLPPKYLFFYDEKQKNITVQRQYLSNHGITLLEIDKTEKDYFPELYNPKSKALAHFLKQISSFQFYADVNELSDSTILDMFYRKLEPLASLNYILRDQVQNILTNCGFVFENEKAILELYASILTYDFDESTRIFHNKFLLVFAKHYEIKETPEYEIISEIISILRKAGISGITQSTENVSEPKSYIEFSEETDHGILSYLVDFPAGLNGTLNIYHMQAYQYWLNEKYSDAYNEYEKLILLYKKQRNYVAELFAIFGRNIMLRYLKHETGFSKESEYKDIKEIDLEQYFLQLPKSLRGSIRVVYRFFNFDYIYSTIYRNYAEIKKADERFKVVENGGIAWSADGREKYASIHYDMINFAARNFITIDNFKEFKHLNYVFIELALRSHGKKTTVLLRDYELFACIKFIDFKDLQNLFRNFYTNENDKRTLSVDSEVLHDLAEKILPSIIASIKNCNHFSERYTDYLCKTLFLLSLLEVDNFKNIVEKTIQIINNTGNSLKVYEAINFFLTVQYNLFQHIPTTELIMRFINTMIDNYIDKKGNFFDRMAISRNYMRNLYSIASVENIEYNDLGKIKTLLTVVSSRDVNEQTEVAISLLLDVYDIGSDEIKEEIKNQLCNINRSKLEISKRIRLDLVLVNYKFMKLTQESLDLIKKYLKGFQNNSFSSFFYNLSALLNTVKYDDIDGIDYNEIENLQKEIAERISNDEIFCKNLFEE